MLCRTRRAAATAAAVLTVAAGIAAPTAAAADGPCQAVASQSTGSEVAVVLEGHYRWPKDTTSDVRLTCHLVQNGVKVVSVTDPLRGHVAALVSDARIGTDPFTVCYTIYVSDPGPVTWPYFTTTNC
ncbi:MAG TPA: hypothetical protein VG318_17675 [Actinomycetota bacterium]|nr:hypothetical protein [Actinomycetota bacterium]